jgi:hypothetical protein
VGVIVVDYVIATLQVIIRYEPGELADENVLEEDVRPFIEDDLRNGNYKMIDITVLKESP